MLKSAKTSLLALTFALLFSAATAGIVNSHAPNGKYDTDGDGLIEVNNLEQLSAIRYDLDGDGTADSENSAEAYARAFTTSGTEVVCAGDCAGYELLRPLDFDEADSYASGLVNTVLITGAGWLPIGTRTDGFNTTFDGNGHTVSNLFIDRTGRLNNPGAVGLFGSIGRSGVIHGIGLVGVDVAGFSHIGGLAGYNKGVINDTRATGTVTGSSSVGGLAGYNGGWGIIEASHATGSVTGANNVGGLAGYNKGVIYNSRATGTVTGSTSVGGLTGYNEGGDISGSHATGAVTGSSGYVGGLAGENVVGAISGSYATGNVLGEGKAVGGLAGGSIGGTINSSYATGAVTGRSYWVGGLAGYNEGRISGSHATGAVSGEVESVGGLVGSHYGTISASHAAGRVTGGHYGIGGLVGDNYGAINTSHTTGSVSGEDESVGGLVGNNNGAISASYATGAVTGRAAVGGLAGDNHGTISGSYATGTVSGDVGSVGGLAGYNEGRISAGYASGTVSGPWSVGGLIGTNAGEHLVGSTYAVGKVLGNSSVGGLIGTDSGYVVAGFWDTDTSDQGTGVGDGDPIVAVGKTTAELQGPTGYTGIYAAWLIDLDNADEDLDFQTGIDEFWDFGTSGQYPALIADFDGDGIPTWQEFGSQRTAPTGLTATAYGLARIDLSWIAPTETAGNPVTAYRIESSVNGSEPWTEVETTSNAGTSYSDTGLTAGTTRYYRVSAVTSAGAGPPSNAGSATTSLWSPLMEQYDANNNGMIERTEVIAAINDYLYGAEGLTRSGVLSLINIYLYG